MFRCQVFNYLSHEVNHKKEYLFITFNCLFIYVFPALLGRSLKSRHLLFIHLTMSVHYSKLSSCPLLSYFLSLLFIFLFWYLRTSLILSDSPHPPLFVLKQNTQATTTDDRYSVFGSFILSSGEDLYEYLLHYNAFFVPGGKLRTFFRAFKDLTFLLLLWWFFLCVLVR